MAVESRVKTYLVLLFCLSAAKKKKMVERHVTFVIYLRITGRELASDSLLLIFLIENVHVLSLSDERVLRV